MGVPPGSGAVKSVSDGWLRQKIAGCGDVGNWGQSVLVRNARYRGVATFFVTVSRGLWSTELAGCEIFMIDWDKRL